MYFFGIDEIPFKIFRYPEQVRTLVCSIKGNLETIRAHNQVGFKDCTGKTPVQVPVLTCYDRNTSSILLPRLVFPMG